MSRLNIKSTKAAFVKELKDLERKAEHNDNQGNRPVIYDYAQLTLLELAKELEIEIKPEEYK